MLKIGHRGACGYEPENTLRSFQKAIDLGADAIELDVSVCKTGELMVIHDDSVNRTTNGSGYVGEMTLNELQKLDAGKGEKIPTLREVFDLVNRKVKINVELKGLGTALPTAKLITEYVMEKGWSYDDFIVSSFNHPELAKFHEALPQVSIGALLDGKLVTMAEFAEKMGAKYINPCYDTVDQEYVDDAHKRGLKVLVWTVKEPGDIAKMQSLGVDGIFCNYPDRL